MHLSCFQFPEIHQAVDQPEQALSVLVDQLERTFQFGGQVCLAQQFVQRGDD